MRLIDADALWMVTDSDGHQYYERFEIDESPTVEAVPVWFIRERMNDLQLSADYEFNELGESNGVATHGLTELRLLVEAWGKQNER